MSLRAIIIGLLLGMGIAVFGYFNDWIMEQAYLATNLAPICVYGLLVVALLGIVPIVRALGFRGLSPREWCVITGMILVASVVPGPGLMWHFSNSLVIPHHANKTNIGWRSHELLRYAPKAMLVDPYKDEEIDPSGKFYQDVVGGFRAGLPPKEISLRKVPWEAWERTLGFWVPLIGLSFISGICLVVVVHRQWSQRERLRYPLAYVASEMIDGWRPKEQGGIFRDKKFWVGFAIPAVILLINGYSEWNIKSIKIPLHVSMLSPFAQKWPILYKVPCHWLLFDPWIYFSAVGFAYFVSSDISLSLGVSAMVYGAVFLLLYTIGVDISGTGMSGSLYSFQMFGSYVGIALVIFYTGRRFYLSVLSKAFWIPTRDPVERDVAWGCRLALLTAAGMAAILIFAAGMDWILAILYVVMVGMMYVVLTRINVETGLFMIQPGWGAAGILLGIFGIAALGPHMLIILAILCVVIAVDPIVSLMPLAANAIKLGEDQKLPLGRLGAWLSVAVIVALVAGIIGTITVQYAHGSGKYGWADSVAKMPFQLLEKNIPKISADPDVKQGLQLGKIQPSSDFMYALGVGLLIALGLSLLRLRYTWWPIHPVLFLIWGTYPGMILAASFLLGWFIKVAVTTFGGGQAYRASKPFFVGLIAGEFAAAIFWSIVGVTYYLIEGVPGPEIRVLPA